MKINNLEQISNLSPEEQEKICARAGAIYTMTKK